MKYKNMQSVAVKVVKVNLYDLGTLQPGEEIDVPLDPETTMIATADVTP